MGERLRSFWGWGWADRFEDEAARRRAGQMVGALLGAPAFEPRPAPNLDNIALPPPRIALPEALADPTSASKRARAEHTYGRSYPDIARGFEGDFSAAPDAVAWPETEEHIAALLTWCSKERVAAIPFGGGTSVVGGTHRPWYLQQSSPPFIDALREH